MLDSSLFNWKVFLIVDKHAVKPSTALDVALMLLKLVQEAIVTALFVQLLLL